MRISRAVGAVLACVVLAAGCGGDDEGGAPEAKKIDQAQADKAKGNVTWCIGKDTTGTFKRGVEAFNKQQSKVKAKLIELPEAADEQRTQLVQRLRAKSSECDVLGTDVIWTAEFAAQGWIQDITAVIEPRKGDWIPSTLETGRYEGKYFAAPYNTNAGFIYFRTDQVSKAPTTWEDLYKQAQQDDGVVYQGFSYEGLTVNFLELLYSAGGKVLSDDGKEVEVDSETARNVLTFMADGVKDGAAPKAVTTYKEQEALRAFQAGNATFMRNWPYAFALTKESKIADDFDIAVFPGYGGKKAAGVLGGYNLTVSSYSKNPGGSAKFVEFLTSPEWQKVIMTKASLPASLSETYDDPDVQKAFPVALELRKAVEQAQARPVSPVYPQISEAIYKNVHDALSGKAQPDAAVSNMSEQIEKALETF